LLTLALVTQCVPLAEVFDGDHSVRHKISQFSF
jgi:hypothetical protein